MANNTLVQTFNVPVFGKDDRYHLSQIDERSFGKWAIHVDQLLTAHPKLAKEKLVPRDSITEAAKAALWNTIPALASVPQDYEDESMADATTARAVNERPLGPRRGPRAHVSRGFCMISRYFHIF